MRPLPGRFRREFQGDWLREAVWIIPSNSATSARREPPPKMVLGAVKGGHATCRGGGGTTGAVSSFPGSGMIHGGVSDGYVEMESSDAEEMSEGAGRRFRDVLLNAEQRNSPVSPLSSSISPVRGVNPTAQHSHSPAAPQSPALHSPAAAQSPDDEGGVVSRSGNSGAAFCIADDATLDLDTHLLVRQAVLEAQLAWEEAGGAVVDANQHVSRQSSAVEVSNHETSSSSSSSSSIPTFPVALLMPHPKFTRLSARLSARLRVGVPPVHDNEEGLQKAQTKIARAHGPYAGGPGRRDGHQRALVHGGFQLSRDTQ